LEHVEVNGSDFAQAHLAMLVRQQSSNHVEFADEHTLQAVEPFRAQSQRQLPAAMVGDQLGDFFSELMQVGLGHVPLLEPDAKHVTALGHINLVKTYLHNRLSATVAPKLRIAFSACFTIPEEACFGRHSERR